MSTFTSIVAPIQWHEGMMLSPHHFQQSELRIHQVLIHQIRLLSSHHWGIQHLKIDPIVLPDGLIRVLELEALMPDGFIVQYSINMPNVPALELDISPYRESKDSIQISCAIPKLNTGSATVSSGNARYLSYEDSNIMDLNTNDNPINIPRLFPKIFLHVGEEHPQNALSFPLLKTKFIDGAFNKLDYTPPCFYLHKESKLWLKISDIAQKIRGKAIYLSERWGNQIGTPMLQETSSVLRALLIGLPSLEVLLHGPAVHPYQLFLKLSEILGSLSTLLLGQVPPVIPGYEHNNINGSFSNLLILIEKYIESIDVLFVSIPFYKKSRLFYLPLKKEYMAEKFYIGVKGIKGMTENKIEEWFQDAIIASDFAIDKARERRITGAPRRLLQNEELYELMPSRNVLVFEVDCSPEFITPKETLHIFNSADSLTFRPSDIMLYLRQSQRDNNPQKEEVI